MVERAYTPPTVLSGFADRAACEAAVPGVEAEQRETFRIHGHGYCERG
jgi:hypothetical protein